MSNGKDRARLAWAAIGALLKAFEVSKVDIPPEEIERATREMFFHHAEHLVQHKMNQTHVDPYKLVCWFGCALLSEATIIKNDKDGRCEFTAIAYAVIRTLTNFLNIDSEGRVILPPKSRQLLIQMLVQEKMRNHRHGIWQNGLYAAFHCSVATLRALTTEAGAQERLAAL